MANPFDEAEAELGGAPAANPFDLAEQEMSAPAGIAQRLSADFSGPNIINTPRIPKTHGDEAIKAGISRAWEFVNTPVIPEARNVKQDRSRFVVDANGIGRPIADAASPAPPQGVTAAMTGAAGAAADFAKFFTSPMGAATLGIGGLAPAAQKAVALSFAGQMASAMPELGTALGEELALPPEQRDHAKISNLISSALLNAGFATAGVMHGLKGAIPDVQKFVEANPDWFSKRIRANFASRELAKSLEGPATGPVEPGFPQADNSEPAQFLQQRTQQPGKIDLQPNPFDQAEAEAQTAGPTAPTEPVKTPVHQAVDNLAKAAAELQAAMQGNQVKPEHVPAGNDLMTRAPRNQLEKTMQEMLAQARTPETPSEPTPPETKMQTSQPEAGTAVPPAPAASLGEGTSTVPPKTPALTVPENRATTIPGAAAETGTGQNARTGADELKDAGAVGAQRLETADDLWHAIGAAVKGREKLRTVDKGQREEAKQAEQFQKRAIAGERPKNDPIKAERISVGNLLEGDQFKVQNHTFTVRSLEFDDAGNLIFVEVKDGPKFGVQRIEADGTEWIHVDKDSFAAGPEHGEDVQPVRPPAPPVPENRKLGGETKGPPLALESEGRKPKAPTPTEIERAALQKELADLQAGELQDNRPLFGAPETVEQQRARLKLEAQRKAEAAAREEMQAQAERRLTAGAEDQTPEMFGAETRVDKSGQSALFEKSESRAQIEQRQGDLDEIAQDLYGRPYDEITEEQKGKVRVTLDAEDAQGGLSRASQSAVSDRRPETPPAEPAAAGTPGELQPPAAKAAPQESSAKLSRRATELKRQQLAREIFRKGYGDLMDAGQARVREELARGREPGSVLTHPVEIRLRELMDERSRLEERLRLGPHFEDASGNIPKGRSVALAAQIRYIDGQIDMLREIARADPKLKSQFIEKFLEGDTPKQIDKVLNYLDSLKVDTQGKLFSFGLPVEVWNTLIDLVKVGVRAGAKLADAIDQAIAQIKAEHPGEKFDEEAARDYFRTTAEADWKPGVDGPQLQTHGELKARQEQISARLGEIERQRRRGSLSDELKGERYVLSKESRAVQRQLSKNEDYVADLLLRMDSTGKEMANARAAGNGAHARELGDQLNGMMEGELAQVPPELLKRVYDDLVARGKIMRENVPDFGKGRTLGELTAWLKSNKLDSPKIPLRERFNLARRLADEFNRGKDNFNKAADRVTSMWRAFWAQYKAPPIDDNFRSLMKDWFDQKQWTGLETGKWVEEIRQAIPQADRRRAVSVWLDAQGDMNLLRAQADLVPPRFKRIWETALTLTSKEQAAARRISLDFEQKLSDSMNMGVIEKGRAEYGVPQIWEVVPKHEGEFDPFKKKQSARRTTAKLDPRAPFFALQRTHPTYFDGIMAGGVPKSLDVGDLVAVYNLDFHNSLADRAVIKSMKDAKTKEGDPLVMISGGVRIEPGANGGRTYFVDSNRRPKDAVTKDGRPYVTVDHWALRDWQFKSVDGAGNPILLSGEFLVHPDHAPFLKNELGKSWLRDPEGGGKYFRWLLDSGAYLKASKLAVGTFHMFTLGEHLAFHAVSGMPTAKRLGLLNPSIRGVEFDPAKNQNLAKLMRHGMNLGLEGPRELFEEGLLSHGGLWGHVPGLGDVMSKASAFCFQRYLPALKVRFGDVVLDANRKRYAKDIAAGKITDDQICEITARQANAAFGAQHWKLMGTNKTLLDVNRLLFLAPDFLLSRAKVVAQATKPYNREQTLFLLAQGGLVYLASRMLNQLLDGDPHWEPENAMRVVYKGRSYAARFIAQDVIHLIEQPVEFAGGRLSPWTRTGIEAVTGRDMWSGARKDVPIDTENKAFRSAQIVAKDMYEWMIPIGAEGYLPGASARAQTGPGNLALSLIGVGSRKYTAQTQLYQLAAEFNRKGDPAAQLHQKQRDSVARGESDFAKFDNLLDAGELVRARREYQELIKDGRDPDNIAKRYKVITVGRDKEPHLSSTFTGSVEREKAFKKSLNTDQLKMYDRAIEERKARAAQFEKMLRVLPASAGE